MYEANTSLSTHGPGIAEVLRSETGKFTVGQHLFGILGTLQLFSLQPRDLMRLNNSTFGIRHCDRSLSLDGSARRHRSAMVDLSERCWVDWPYRICFMEGVRTGKVRSNRVYICWSRRCRLNRHSIGQA